MVDKKNVKKSVVSKPNTIKSMFIASAGKKNTDVSSYILNLKISDLFAVFQWEWNKARSHSSFLCLARHKLLLQSLVYGAFLKILCFVENL